MRERRMRSGERALATVFVFGQWETLDIVIRQDTSCPWDKGYRVEGRRGGGW